MDQTDLSGLELQQHIAAIRIGSDLRKRFERLTAREQQVLRCVISGLLNKQVAAELGISEITVHAHRRRVMQKMGAVSFADLVRSAASVGVRPLPLGNRLLSIRVSSPRVTYRF